MLATYLNERAAAAGINVAGVVLLLQQRGIEVDYSTVWRWFASGPKGRTPSLRHFAALSEVLGMDDKERSAALSMCLPMAA